MPTHTIICLDNSEYMRNGDITPNRLEAQQVAAMKQCNSVLEGPESTIGLLKMAGDYPKLLLALGKDKFNLRAELGSCQIEGSRIELINSMKKAYLAVKKRSDDDVGDRSIYVFVGSPLKGIDQDEFMKLAGRLRKSNIAVTFINFAGEDALVPNQEILQQFIDKVNKDNNSRLESVPPGPHILADMISQGSQSGGSSNQFDFNEDMDPALAAAIRLSLIESGQAPPEETSQPPPQQQQQPENALIDPDMDDDLAMAIRLSLQEEENRKRQEQQDTMEDDASDDESDGEDDEEEDDFELQQALAMSMMDAKPKEEDKVDDEDFLTDVVGNLPGVNKKGDSSNDKMEDDDELEKQKKKKDDEK
mmetsp:Transcript_8684/g.12831  ORF Transcript_8684/g.12831 Transcript_8684/m.12831 type:complete len:362 (+) Transcript_8684:154-1239(+)